MLCERCNGIEFQPLLARDTKSGFHILHQTRASYTRSLARRCALCTLISSQLGEVELKDDICAQLEAFMVLKRRWPAMGKEAASFPVNVQSRLGFGTLAVMDALPVQYKALESEGKTSNRVRKRKRGQIEAPDASEELIPQAAVSHHTGSHENMELAGQWINDCLKSHKMCTSGISHCNTTFRPTRLIDTQDPGRPFLTTTKDTVDMKYIVLSYVWGSEVFKTKHENVEDHQHCIPLERVPKTIAHAFQVTRELGYRYIWVDALCIIQDDDDDLEHELAIMGNIYRYAVFTVFAEGAPGAFAGLFQKRDPQSYRPCTVNVKIRTDRGVVSEHLTLGTIATGPNYLKERGWVLQEGVLSSRCLSFGKQISWKCTVSEASETRPVPHARKTALTHGRATCEDKLKMWLYAPVQMRETPREQWFRWNQYDAWYSIVEEYSTKSLTHETDHLRALSGLADLFQRAHPSVYVAGLWKDDLKLGLAWYVASNCSRPMKAVGLQKPSWSWASVGMVRLKFRSWRAYSTHVSSEGAEILGASCTPASKLNSTGSVVDGILKLRTRVKKLTLRWSTEYVADRTEFSHGSYFGREAATMTKGEHPRFPALVFDLESPAQLLGEAALDRPVRTRPGTGITRCEREVWCALLHVQKSSDKLRFTALVLDHDQTAYRRLGLLFIDDPHVVPFSDWRMQAIDIL